MSAKNLLRCKTIEWCKCFHIYVQITIKSGNTKNKLERLVYTERTLHCNRTTHVFLCSAESAGYTIFVRKMGAHRRDPIETKPDFFKDSLTFSAFYHFRLFYSVSIAQFHRKLHTCDCHTQSILFFSIYILCHATFAKQYWNYIAKNGTNAWFIHSK